MNNLVLHLKNLLPRRLRRSLYERYLYLMLDRAVGRLTALAEGEVPDRKTLALLRRGWGNPHWSADLDYLEELSRRAAATPGPVLECGSGLTTLLLGLLAGKKGIPVWSLEHHPEWYNHTRKQLARYGICSVRLCLAPLRDYGAYMWYDPPVEDMPTPFRLTVCDGPPGTTPGGRYGLLPVMSSHLAPDSTILFDDVERRGEARTLERWAEENGVQFTLSGKQGVFAVVTLP